MKHTDKHTHIYIYTLILIYVHNPQIFSLYLEENTTHFFTNTVHLILCRKIITFCCGNHTELVNRLCCQKSEIRCSTKRYNWIFGRLPCLAVFSFLSTVQSAVCALPTNCLFVFPINDICIPHYFSSHEFYLFARNMQITTYILPLNKLFCPHFFKISRKGT